MPLDGLLKTDRARFLVQNLNLPKATGVPDAEWEYFQLAHLNDDSLLRIETKSRQIAWSWLSAAEAVAEAILSFQDSVFVSYNLDDAKEKIRYALQIYHSLEIGGLPKIIGESQLRLQFENKRGGTPVRLVSLPSKPPRGKAKTTFYLDEFAHAKNDKDIYKGATALILKGGRGRIGSSPLGATGTFWEIFEQELQPYPGYTRKTTAWYEIQAFCKNVLQARKLAPRMDTAARVEMFGNDRIKAIFSNMLLEDFQQEFEAMFVDESTAWLTWHEIKEAQDTDFLSLSIKVSGGDAIADAHVLQKACAAIDRLKSWIERGLVELVYAVGADIGRTKNATEIFCVGIGDGDERASTSLILPASFNGKTARADKKLSLRLQISLHNCDFDLQEAVFRYLLDTIPITGCQIDQNGIGRNISERLEKAYPVKVQPAVFTNETKTVWATDTKMYFQKGIVTIPVDNDLAYQLHSIKKMVSPSKNLIFDTARNEKHHADKFWALALAFSAYKHGARFAGRRRLPSSSGGRAF